MRRRWHQAGPLVLLALVSCTDSPSGPLDNWPEVGLGPGASLQGRRPFPDDNPWNQDISNAPVDPNSATLIASCGIRNLHPDFGTTWNGAPTGIPYVVVSGSQLACRSASFMRTRAIRARTRFRPTRRSKADRAARATAT